MTEAENFTLRIEGIAVDDDNDPAPDNAMQSDDVFTTSSYLTFGFHGADHWRHSGNFPVGRSKLNMTPNPSIYHMSCLELFAKL